MACQHFHQVRSLRRDLTVTPTGRVPVRSLKPRAQDLHGLDLPGGIATGTFDPASRG
jgi:hypothetical protein